MELTTIINHCYRFPGFVYERAKWSADKKSIEVRVRPRVGSAAVCSRCHQPGCGYDHLDERRFEFIPFWGLLKRKDNLSTPQRFRLRDLLHYNLATVRAYLLKEDFQQLWEYSSPTWAGKFLDEWCRQTMRSRIEAMKKVARMLRSHRQLILNYFRAKKQLSSGVVEGLNNKAKLTMRKSYGFRTFRITELALYHALGKLPEPQLTHRFY